MNSTASTSVEGVVPSLDIVIGTDRLFVDAPGTGWKSVGIDPWLADIVSQSAHQYKIICTNSPGYGGGKFKVIIFFTHLTNDSLTG